MGADVTGAAFILGSRRTTASHTIGIPHLAVLLREVSSGAPAADYRHAVVEDNILGRPTQTGRQRSFRHLRELYFMDPSRPEFFALRHFWNIESSSGPLLAGILAFTRDEVLRASFSAISDLPVGSSVTSADLSAAVATKFGHEMSESTLAKTGRNTGACWTQTGHLAGRAKKVRTEPAASPVAIAYAAYLGHLAGGRGLGVLDNPWSQILGLERGHSLEALRAAHNHGLVDLLVAGNVVDVTFPALGGAG
ncbi:hypothetical protein JVY00_15325 [Tsukamurella tyrosinosolvens]|uniref:hypothetical protein n=1 Tax=Tsukamurella tyrosinosolvens TaxID=57704 RepID=UPI001AF15B91|nr:hypothetical protein [Tsukamurella tyrosinosolvens]QRY83243.1 hypothetical protein JVY00_15325 [Tsukamurella tyrosinosolvens]